MDLHDVTLREAAQMPGRNYDVDQRVAAGRQLDDLGLPLVQAGFPAAGADHAAVVERLATDLEADVVALARATPADVEAALDAGADVVEVFGTLSDRHLTHVVGRSREAMLAALEESLEMVADAGATPHCSLTDAFRTDATTLADGVEALPQVARVSLADSIGGATPAAVRTHLDAVAAAGVDLDRVGVHCHDDLGVATANVLAAAEAGAAYADVSVASLGERVGNPALEEVVVAADAQGLGTFGLDAAALVPTCRGVLDALGEVVDERKPVLGRAATEHEAGIHTAAMLVDPATFEPYDPATYGDERRLRFGTGTGRTGARRLLERAAVAVTDDRVDALLDRLADEGPVSLDRAMALAGAVADEASDDG